MPELKAEDILAPNAVQHEHGVGGGEQDRGAPEALATLALGASRFAGMVDEQDAQVPCLDEVIEEADHGVHVLGAVFIAGQEAGQRINDEQVRLVLSQELADPGLTVCRVERRLPIGGHEECVGPKERTQSLGHEA